MMLRFQPVELVIESLVQLSLESIIDYRAWNDFSGEVHNSAIDRLVHRKTVVVDPIE